MYEDTGKGHKADTEMEQYRKRSPSSQKKEGGGKDISTIYYAPGSVLCSDCTDRQDLPLRGSQPGEEKRESEKMVLPTEKARRDGNTSVKGGSSSWKAEVSVHGGKGGARTPRDLLERQVQSRD